MLEYLLGWARELVGRSGVGLDGAAPLSYSTVRDWAILTGRTPQPHEVEALLVLDSVMRHPETQAEAVEPAEQTSTPWPIQQR